jgi:hypothetical protein
VNENAIKILEGERAGCVRLVEGLYKSIEDAARAHDRTTVAISLRRMDDAMSQMRALTFAINRLRDDDDEAARQEPLLRSGIAGEGRPSV